MEVIGCAQNLAKKPDQKYTEEIRHTFDHIHLSQGTSVGKCIIIKFGTRENYGNGGVKPAGGWSKLVKVMVVEGVWKTEWHGMILQ